MSQSRNEAQEPTTDTTTSRTEDPPPPTIIEDIVPQIYPLGESCPRPLTRADLAHEMRHQRARRMQEWRVANLQSRLFISTDAHRSRASHRRLNSDPNHPAPRTDRMQSNLASLPHRPTTSTAQSVGAGTGAQQFSTFSQLPRETQQEIYQLFRLFLIRRPSEQGRYGR